jgi:putative SOS response-associated peptidase YedK
MSGSGAVLVAVQSITMCGRYRLSRTDKQIAEHFDTSDEVEWSPRYNITPAQRVCVVRQNPERPVRQLSIIRWGLIPFWAKDANVGYKMINARAETVAEKPAYRESFKTRRCLIPADGFYEWNKVGKVKQPYHFGMQDDSLFAFAGIWDRWKNPQGEIIETCSILTTTPNVLLADVHDRMPVIMPVEHYDLWLDPGFKNTDDLKGLLRPYEPSLMRRYPVSTRVNLVKNDDQECAAELKEHESVVTLASL